jgi:hypothetical protein
MLLQAACDNRHAQLSACCEAVASVRLVTRRHYKSEALDDRPLSMLWAIEQQQAVVATPWGAAFLLVCAASVTTCTPQVQQKKSSQVPVLQQLVQHVLVLAAARVAFAGRSCMYCLEFTARCCMCRMSLHSAAALHAIPPRSLSRVSAAGTRTGSARAPGAAAAAAAVRSHQKKDSMQEMQCIQTVTLDQKVLLQINRCYIRSRTACTIPCLHASRWQTFACPASACLTVCGRTCVGWWWQRCYVAILV